MLDHVTAEFLVLWSDTKGAIPRGGARICPDTPDAYLPRRVRYGLRPSAPAILAIRSSSSPSGFVGFAVSRRSRRRRGRTPPSKLSGSTTGSQRLGEMAV